MNDTNGNSLDIYESMTFDPSDHPGGRTLTLTAAGQTISFTVPADVNDGQTIYIPNVGNQDPLTGRRGDLFVTINIKPTSPKIPTKPLLIAVTAIVIMVLIVVLLPKLFGGKSQGNQLNTNTDSHNHTWVSATCTHPKTCSICGQTSGGKSDHQWVSATATAPKTCATCGATEGLPLASPSETESAAPIHTHTWVSANCTSPETCSSCGATSGSPSGHQWIEATYSAPKTCAICGVTEGIALSAPPIFLNELGVMSGHEGKVWTRSTSAPAGAYHTNKDARSSDKNKETCWGDWSIPGHTTGTVKDQYGNIYTYGIFIDGKDSQAYYMEFYLGGKYSTFSGTCACPDRDSAVSSYVYNSSTKYAKSFDVYLDGEYAGSSPTMRYDYAPEKFEFDVTGVMILKIVYPSTKGPNEVASIYDGKLSCVPK